jgi:hypothetical protein
MANPATKATFDKGCRMTKNKTRKKKKRKPKNKKMRKHRPQVLSKYKWFMNLIYNRRFTHSQVGKVPLGDRVKKNIYTIEKISCNLRNKYFATVDQFALTTFL